MATIEKWTTAIEVCDTTDMTEDDWQKMRGGSDRLGGSDQGVIMGCSPYKTALELYNEKAGLDADVPQRPMNEDALTTGHIFEMFVAINFIRKMRMENPHLKIRLVKDILRDVMPYLESFYPENRLFRVLGKTAKKLFGYCRKSWGINPNGYFQCGAKNPDGTLKYPFAYANIDGIVEVIQEDGTIERGIFEAKTLNPDSPYGREAIRKYWKMGIVPEYYYWQIVFYMAVMDLDFTYITCCWGYTLANTEVILVKRDLEAEKLLMEADTEFMYCLESGIDLDCSEMKPELLNSYYQRKYGILEEKENLPVELPMSFESKIKAAMDADAKLQEAMAEVERLEQEKLKFANELYGVMGSKANSYATLTMSDGEKMGIKLQIPTTKPKFDVEALKAAEPAAYEEAVKMGKGKFSITNLRKIYPGLANKYQPPSRVDPGKGPTGYKIYNYESGEGASA